jgi:hypothetical protein
VDNEESGLLREQSVPHGVLFEMGAKHRMFGKLGSCLVNLLLCAAAVCSESSKN